MPTIAIIGGGLSGLAAAYRIQQARPDASITLIERNSRAGGNIGTIHRDGFTLELGPNGIFDAKPHTLRLCEDLGLGARLIAGSEAARKNRFLFLQNELHKLPGSPLGLLRTPLLSTRGKLAMLMEPLRRRSGAVPGDESVAAFARRRFGREAADVFLNALVTGIHAGDPERLSLAACFPRLATFEKEAGSVLRGALRAGRAKRRDAQRQGKPRPGPQRMWSFREGLQVLIDTLVARLGDAVHLGVGVSGLERSATGWVITCDDGPPRQADAVVLTTPAWHQAELLANIDPELAQEIGSITYNRIAVVGLGYRRSDVRGPQDGFGYIAPENTARDVLGVQWCSSIYPDRAPEGYVLWRALMGGVRRADAYDGDDATLIRRAHEEMRITMGVTGEPVFTHVVRWPRAIPQCEVGHPARVARIMARVERHPGLLLGGNAYHGVAMNDCTEQAERLAERFASGLCQ